MVTDNSKIRPSDPVADALEGPNTPPPTARVLALPTPMQLSRGETLTDIRVAYETYGTLNDARDNAVLVCHALSGDSHVARHDADDTPGWWDIMVGPGKHIDTEVYFVICCNVLGGCRGSTGPGSIDPRTGKPYGAAFPDVTIEDMVDVQARLVQQLGIEKLRAVIGGSLGGLQALVWGTRYPTRVASVCPIAACPRLTSQTLAFDVVGRNAIRRDPNFADGQYYDKPDKPDTGLAIARMLGHITYLSLNKMASKFDADKHSPRDIPTGFEKEFSVGSYLAHQGDKFVDRFDANSYITLSLAMDRFELGADEAQLTELLAAADGRWLVISFTSDWLFPAFQAREIVRGLLHHDRPVTHCCVQTDCGHDAFLLSDEVDVYGSLVESFLEEPPGPGEPMPRRRRVPLERSTRLFDDPRLDYGLILRLIDHGASVLDLGCGHGELLARLRQRGHDRLLGIELDEASVVACADLGLQVIQADLNRGLRDFRDEQFDFVLLSQTLQSITHTEDIVREMLRVGRRCVVSFPNFAYAPIRDALAKEGRSPGIRGGLLHYEWYETPNRRFLSILDWQEFCQTRDITVHDALFVETTGKRIIDESANPNLNADLAIFVISKGPSR